VKTKLNTKKFEKVLQDYLAKNGINAKGAKVYHAKYEIVFGCMIPKNPALRDMSFLEDRFCDQISFAA